MTAALLVAALAVLSAPTTSATRRLTPVFARGTSTGHVSMAAVVAVLGTLVVGVAATAPTAGLALALVVGTVAHRVRRARRDRRHDVEIRSLLAGLDVAVADLRVGAHPESACSAAAAESAGGSAEAFRSAAATARLGGSAAHGLLTGARRDSDHDGVTADLDRIAAAWRIAERHGVPLAELLDAARTDLVGRRRFRARVDAGMAGARATATVLACLPVLGIALGQMMGAHPIGVLLAGGIGGVLLVVGTALACAGLAWADRITRKVAA
ncbi:type II secretion system F family protein [Rhodococcus gannanensis]|uniref:Type II secretion system F family protein n=1 Tax=Rhodococcus gannanensis TaxID=1960308 RepID=A0ABW4PCQ4_9NOCA